MFRVSAPDGDQETGTTGEPAGAPAPRPSRRGCTVRALLALSLAAVLCLALALALLGTDAGGAAARVALERWASTAAGGPVRIADLDLDPWRAEATATAVSLRRPGTSVDVGRIDVAWSPGAGVSMRLERPVVVVQDTGEPDEGVTRAEGFAAQPWRVLEHVGRAEVIEGRVEMRDVTGAPWLVLGRVDAETRPGSRRIGVRIADAAAGWPAGGLRLKPAVAEATLSLDGGGLVVEEARVATGSSSLELHGRLDRLSPITANATARVVFDGDLVAALASGTEAKGRIEGDVAADAVENRVKGTLDVSAPALTVMGVGPWQVSGHGRIENARLVLDPLTAEGYGGRLVAEGSLALASTAKTDARVRAEGIDVAALARAFSKAEVPVAARAFASLHWATTGWDVDAARGTGEIALRPLEGAGRRAAPGIPLTGSGRLVVEGRALALESAHLEARGARLEADARLSADGGLRGAWRARLPLDAVGALAADVGSEARVPEGFAGDLVAEGDLGGTAAAPVASLRIRSEGLLAHGRALALEGEARYAAGRLSLAPLAARSGEGLLTLAGSLPARAGAGDWDLQGDARAFDLAPLLAMAGIEGRGEASGTLGLTGQAAAPVGRAELSARLALPGGASAREEEVSVVLSAEGESGRVRVNRLEADLAGGRIEGSGAYDSASRAVEAKAKASGLAWSRLPRLPVAARRVDGTLAVDVTLSGTVDAPAGNARATLAGPTLDGSPLPELALDAHADGRRLEIAGQAGESSVLEGAGTLEGEWPMRLEIDVAALPAQALLDALRAAALEGATIETRGTLVADVALRDPKRLRYAGEGLAASGLVRGLEWSIEPFRLEGTAEEARLAGLRLSTRAVARAGGAPTARAEDAEAGAEPRGGTLTVDGRIPLAETGTFDLALSGDLTLAAFEAVVPDSRAGGWASLRAHVRGTLAAPEADGTFGIVGGRARVEGARLTAVQVTGRFQGREALVERAAARLLGGTLAATGSLPLTRPDAGYPARLRFEATDVDLSRLAIPFAERAADAPSFLVSVSGDLEATAPGLAGLRGEGRFTKLESKSTEGTVGLAAPAAWRLADGHLVQEPLRLAGPLGTLEASAAVVLTGTPKGSFSLNGPFDLRLVGPFVPDTTLAGPARVDLRGEWNESGLRLQGGLSVDAGRVTLETLAFSASRLEAEVRFLGDRAEVDATAAAGDGRLVAYGSLHFSPRLLGPGALSFEAERVPIAYPDGFRGRATGAVLVEGDAGRYRTSGLVDLTQAYYTAEFDARKDSLDRLDYQVAALRGQGSVLESLPLAIDVRFQDPLRIRNSQAQVDVVGTVTANGTLAQPVATGQVSLLTGGQVTVRRARIRVQEGRVELNGYPTGVPEVDFEGLTQVGGVTMSLRAQGSVDDLQLDIRSPNRPDLSQTDLVSLLLTGRTSQSAAAEGGAIVTEELAAALGGALQKGVGETVLIDVSSDASMLLDEGDPTQRFKIGTRVGRNLAVFYSTRLDGTERRWVGQWNPRGGRFTFRAIQDSEEGTIAEATDRLSFNVFPRREAPGRKASAPVSKLGSLRFEGVLPLPEEELRRAAKLSAGKRYDPLRLAEAGDRVRARLVEAGFRGAVVEERNEAAAGRQGHVDLVLAVEAGPRIVVSWTGDDPGEKVRERALAAWPPYASPEAAAASLARVARIELQASGRYEAKVAHEVREADAGVEVVVAVELGPPGRGVDVVFEGNRALADEELARTLPRPGSRAFFDALDRRARLVAGARVAYAGVGHLRARLGPARTLFDAESGRLVVTIPVREGASSRVATLTLPDGVPPLAEGGPALELREGEPFDVEAYLADRDRLAAWYRREGYVEARVRGVLEVAGGDVRVTLAADPGPRPRLGEIRVASNGRTYEKMVRRAIQSRPGEVLRPHELAETRARLSELGTFSSVDVRTVPVPGKPDVRDLEVSYVERPDVELEYGLRYNFSAGGSATSSGTTPAEDAPSGPSEGRLQAAATLTLASPFGYGWRFGGYTLQTSARQNYRLGLQASTLFGLRVKTQLVAFDETDDDSQIAESFASKVRGFSLQQSRTLLRDTGGRRWHERLRLQWGYTNKDIQYSEEIGSPDVVAGNRAFFSVALIGDQRDSLADPRKGLFWTATTEWSRRFLGSDVDYVRLYGQVFTYLPVARGVVWAQGLRAGVVPGDDPFYLLENRFQAGGPTTVRGFRQNGLGPQLTEDEGLGGQGVFVMNQELRFPIWKSVKGGVFWDAGNSWLWAYEFSLRDLRHTVGGGLRIMFPFGPIRLEYGFILDRRETEPRGRFVFGLGHAF
jgi:outer membrane protein assembly factor BamA